ncbi:Zn-dependent protease [Acinetobacter baumannii]|nr:Zn-dependent protease [Acinetobacter baumannii]
MPAFEWVHVQLHQQKGMISLSPPTICNSAHFANFLQRLNDKTEEDLNKASQSTSPTSQKESSDNKLSIAVVDALSSHPATEERIRMVHDFEKKQHANY